MKNERVAAGGNGIGLGSLLGVLFIALKLTDQINWSWWWVLAPFWIPAAVVGIIFFAALLLVLVGRLLKIS